MSSGTNGTEPIPKPLKQWFMVLFSVEPSPTPHSTCRTSPVLARLSSKLDAFMLIKYMSTTENISTSKKWKCKLSDIRTKGSRVTWARSERRHTIVVYYHYDYCCSLLFAASFISTSFIIDNFNEIRSFVYYYGGWPRYGGNVCRTAQWTNRGEWTKIRKEAATTSHAKQNMSMTTTSTKTTITPICETNSFFICACTCRHSSLAGFVACSSWFFDTMLIVSILLFRCRFRFHFHFDFIFLVMHTHTGTHSLERGRTHSAHSEYVSHLW